MVQFFRALVPTVGKSVHNKKEHAASDIFVMYHMFIHIIISIKIFPYEKVKENGTCELHCKVLLYFYCSPEVTLTNTYI